ncbi:MAG: hypothetical protein K2N34_09300 [Lachnospiraceae bacterium]|nr:hypothetical protein [Lachnospiraceae bacterium]
MKKKSIVKKMLTLICLFSSICLFTACGGSEKPEVTITLDGKAIGLEETLQSSLDRGLIMTDANGEETKSTLVFEAMEVIYNSIHLGTEATPHRSEVTVMLYNDTDSMKSAAGSKVMTLNYDLTSDSSDQAPVLFNDIDFWGMTQDEAVAALAEKGFGVDSDKVNNEYHFLVFSGKNDVTVTIDFDLGSEFENAGGTTPQKKVLEFDPNTYYVSGLKASISSKLKIDFGN